jgi:hypothetical protein
MTSSICWATSLKHKEDDHGTRDPFRSFHLQSAPRLETRRWGLVMPVPARNHVQVVRCKGCKRCVPISIDVVIGSVTVACPVCMERWLKTNATPLPEAAPAA